VLVLPLINQGFCVVDLIASLCTALIRSGPHTLAFGTGVVLQSAESLKICECLFGFVAAFAGLFTDAGPSFLHTDIGQGGVKAGELDCAVVALGTGRDCVEDLELDYFTHEDLAEEFPGVEAVWLEISQ
jgi:hypothetical protein